MSARDDGSEERTLHESQSFIKHSLDERLDAFPHNCDSGTIMFRSDIGFESQTNSRYGSGMFPWFSLT
jgi:hypothetical protein